MRLSEVVDGAQSSTFVWFVGISLCALQSLLQFNHRLYLAKAHLLHGLNMVIGIVEVDLPRRTNQFIPIDLIRNLLLFCVVPVIGRLNYVYFQISRPRIQVLCVYYS